MLCCIPTGQSKTSANLFMQWPEDSFILPTIRPRCCDMHLIDLITALFSSLHRSHRHGTSVEIVVCSLPGATCDRYQGRYLQRTQSLLNAVTAMPSLVSGMKHSRQMHQQNRLRRWRTCEPTPELPRLMEPIMALPCRGSGKHQVMNQQVAFPPQTSASSGRLLDSKRTQDLFHHQ